MAKEEADTWELDEPAARTHTPPGWPIKVIEFSASGKAPKKYGPNTYRFGASLTLSVVLPRRGWSLVKQTKNYAYLTPPPDQLGPNFRISIAVPPASECLAIARRCHARAESWAYQLGEWPAWYLHERNRDMRRLWRDPVTGEMASELHPAPPGSSLSIGQWGIWEMHVSGIAGNFVIGRAPPAAPANGSLGVPADALTEGELRTVELTKHERNVKARRECIRHFGYRCQACDLSYEDRYGPIGADLIHVHHLTPLSEIGEAYRVDPIRDLVPLCANCHHVVHRRNPPYSIAELRSVITEQAKRTLA
ncbi:HNH endonuclease [Mesorhizobium sp. M1340]|uniref:HNH endonuclease n=2 Tax=unclassified Mesorhizobium TaxID=325217 RepID=UPI00333722A5